MAAGLRELSTDYEVNVRDGITRVIRKCFFLQLHRETASTFLETRPANSYEVILSPKGEFTNDIIHGETCAIVVINMPAYGLGLVPFFVLIQHE